MVGDWSDNYLVPYDKDSCSINSGKNNKREIDLDHFGEALRDDSLVRQSLKWNIKKLPSVMHNKRFFPSDFFNQSPKSTEPRRGQAPRSAVRRDIGANGNLLW